VIAFIALMAMMGIVVCNIIGRIFFKAPVMGTLEIAGFAGVIVVAVAIGFAQREHRNIFVDIVVARFPARIRIIVDSFTYLLSLGAVGFLFWAVAESAFESLIQEEITLTLGIKTFPFRFIWAAGLLILCGFLLQHLIQNLSKGLKK
jgi:TRAP-type C4-dicarboxylate transport system permease small subunit